LSLVTVLISLYSIETVNKIMKKFLLTISILFLASCSSTGVKNISDISPPSSSEGNIYIKRGGGYVLGGTRAIIKINGNEVGSLWTNEFLKVNMRPGNGTLTVAGDLSAGVFGSTNIPVNAEAGKSYYFITGVESDKGIGIFLGGAIGQAITGGPFPTQQVSKEAFFGYQGEPASNKPKANTTEQKQNLNLDNKGDIAGQIKSLNDLYKSGALSKDEFEKAKTKLLK
jgi:hypothetical protein